MNTIALHEGWKKFVESRIAVMKAGCPASFSREVEYTVVAKRGLPRLDADVIAVSQKARSSSLVSVFVVSCPYTSRNAPADVVNVFYHEGVFETKNGDQTIKRYRVGTNRLNTVSGSITFALNDIAKVSTDLSHDFYRLIMEFASEDVKAGYSAKYEECRTASSAWAEATQAPHTARARYRTKEARRRQFPTRGLPTCAARTNGPCRSR